MRTLNRNSALCAAVLLSSLVLGACESGSGSAEEEPQPTPQEMAAAMEAMATPQPDAASGARRLSAEELAGRLPASALGIAQTDAQAISSGSAGTVPTSATARYVDENSGRIIEIGIVDAGAIEGKKQELAGWATTRIARNTANGFERTGTFGSYPAFESEERVGNALSTKFSVAAGDYIVQLAGQGVSLAQLRQLAADLDLSGLSR